MKSANYARVLRGLAIAVAAGVSDCAFAQISGLPTTLLGASTDGFVFVDYDAATNYAGDENTGNGAVVDNGISRATALYTGNDGFVSVAIRPNLRAYGVSAEASVDWYFTVLGPKDAIVPLALIGNGHVAIQNSTTDEMAFAVGKITSSIPQFNEMELLQSNGYIPIGITAVAYVLDNTSYEISMLVAASSYFNSFNIGTTPSIDASIDPLVAFADGFDSAGFTILASDVPPSADAPAASTVPEPPTSWILMAGIGGLFALRKRQQPLRA